MTAMITPVANEARPWLLGDDSEWTLLFAAARDAQLSWAQQTPARRVAILRRLGPILAARMDEICALVVDENGKPEVEAISHEIGACIGCVSHLGSHAVEILAGRRETNTWLPFRLATVTPRAIGAVLIIAPWNMPLVIPFTQAVTALAAGNAVVLKPSEVTPRVGQLVGDLMVEAGLPAGLFTVVQGDGKTGAALVAARPDKVFFTGSVATGRTVMAAAAAHPVPVCLELGGVDAMIVRPDANLEFAVSAATWGALFNGGQVCASVERLLVSRDISDAFTSRLVDRIAQLDPARDLGRITFAGQRRVYDRHLADARARGLTIVCGGAYLSSDKLAPTVIVGEGIEDALVWREESFGPIVALSTFRGDDDAIAKHNASPCGLTASIFSEDAAAADRMATRLDVGSVSINDVAAALYARPELPWGGRGESGFGSSHGREGLLAFTRPHVIDRPTIAGLDFKRPWWFPYDHHQLAAMRELALAMAAGASADRLSRMSKLGRHVLSQLANRPRL